LILQNLNTLTDTFNVIQKSFKKIKKGLFPLLEGPGVNPQAFPLTKNEIEIFQQSQELKEKLFKSFEMMMNFYGIQVNKETKKFSRTKDWILHYENLENSPHNFLRITRILKSIGFLGLAEWKKPFLEHVAKEIVENGELRACGDSFVRFWIPTLDSQKEVNEILSKIKISK
jgi:hypothetical protein